MEAGALLDDARWQEAKVACEAALAAEETPDALDGLGLARWMLGDIAGGVAARERAFDLFVRAGRRDDAARTAAWVSHQHGLAGRASAARGWLARAERELTGEGTEGHGWIIVERARHAPTLQERAAQARAAMEIARRHGASDLEVFALSVLGQAEVRAGRIEPGMALLEEAMAAASSGTVCNVHTLAEAYCNLIAACTDAGDWERAAEWCEHVDRFAREHETMPLLGACRTIHADVLVARGRWPEAEDALESALETHARFLPSMALPTRAAMAELRVRQGRLAEARDLLASGPEDHPGALRALARLRIAEGEPVVAIALLERALAAAPDDPVRIANLLAPLTDALLAAGDVEAARAAAGRLADAAEGSGIRLSRALAGLAAARVALAADRPEEAAGPATRACADFGTLAMPLEKGEARLELARALAATEPGLAREEARAAQEAFRMLGAQPALDAAARVLRELGASSRERDGGLTAREREVIELVAQGCSNAQIARSLFITEKTAGHHVSHILSKLGVRNRAEAAAHAVRAGMGSR